MKFPWLHFFVRNIQYTAAQINMVELNSLGFNWIAMFSKHRADRLLVLGSKLITEVMVRLTTLGKCEWFGFLCSMHYV